MQEILIRPGKDGDVRFISNSWLKGYRSSDMGKNVIAKTYFHHQHKLLDNLIPNSVVKVACNAERPDQILGWICAQPTTECLIVHFCYVKHPFRGLGIARMLLKGLLSDYELEAVVYTHRTKLCWDRKRFEPREHERLPRVSFAEKLRSWGFLYNPYLAWTAEAQGYA